MCNERLCHRKCVVHNNKIVFLTMHAGSLAPGYVSEKLSKRVHSWSGFPPRVFPDARGDKKTKWMFSLKRLLETNRISFPPTISPTPPRSADRPIRVKDETGGTEPGLGSINLRAPRRIVELKVKTLYSSWIQFPSSASQVKVKLKCQVVHCWQTA